MDGNPQLRSRFQSQPNSLPKRPYVGVAPDYRLPPMEATSGTETLFLQGSLDYAIGIVKAYTEQDLETAGLGGKEIIQPVPATIDLMSDGA